MRKRKKGKKLGRERDQRKALKRSLAESLFKYEKIKTTLSKAKEIRGFVDGCITKAKKGDLSSRRYLDRFFDRDMVNKLVKEIAPRYQDRRGGYTRITKLGPRQSDGAEMSVIELV